MSDEPVSVELTNDKTHKKCQRCQQVHPKDKRYFKPNGGSGYFKHECLQCEYEIGKEAGLAVEDPKMGMDREEYQQWKRDERRAKRAALKPDKPPKEEKPKGPSPWQNWATSSTSESFSVNPGQSEAASSSPVEEPETRNSGGRVKVFNLDPEIKKTKTQTLLIINDYMRLDPKHIVAQRPNYDKIKVVPTADPKPKFIPPAHQRVPIDDDPEDDEGFDEEYEDSGSESGPPMPINYHQELVKLIKTYPGLAKDFNVTLEDVHNMSPTQQYQTFVEMSFMRGHARGADILKSVVVTSSMIIENSVKSSRFSDKVLLDGYSGNVLKSEAIDSSIKEICQKYSQEIEEYCEPEYMLAFSMLSEALNTHLTNQDLGFKNGKR